MPKNTKPSIKRRREKRLLDRAENKLQTDPGVEFTAEALARLEQLEAEAMQEMESNPNLKLQFGTVTDFLQQWELLEPKDQKALGAQFQERANALVDIPFEQELTDARTVLKGKLDTLNQKFQFLKEDEAESLAGKLDKLDSDSVSSLTRAFTSIQDRGLGDSGAMRKIADSIINEKEDAIEKANLTAGIDLRQGEESLALGTKNLESAQVGTERDIAQRKLVAERQKADELVSRQAAVTALQGEIAGDSTLSPRVNTPLTPETVDPGSLPAVDETSVSPVADVDPIQRVRNLRVGNGDTVEPAVAETTRNPRLPALEKPKRRNLRLPSLPRI